MERTKLRVNVGKSKVTRCSRCVNVGRMHVRLNGEPPLVEWIVLSTCERKYQLMEDGKGMWYTEWMGIKRKGCWSVLYNKGFGSNAEKCLEGIIVPTALYGEQALSVVRRASPGCSALHCTALHPEVLIEEGKWMFLMWSVWEVWRECQEWLRNKQVSSRGGIERELATGVD